MVDRHWRIYRKVTGAQVDLDARLPSIPAGAGGAKSGRVPQGAPVSRYSVTQLLGTYDALLEKYMPPSLLLSDRGEIVHSFSGASRFLRMRDGRQGLDVLDAVEPEFRTSLRGALQRTLNGPSSLVIKGVRAEPGGGEPYDVAIERVRGASGVSSLLVSFESASAASPRPAPVPHQEIALDEAPVAQVARLEAELTATNQNLQAAIEQLQASNEELQASNEELQSSNEELQSTNEELQSVNEELYTVNAEYQRKIAELTELTNDMDNLLASTDVGTIFLDKHLHIRKFTPSIAESFNLLPQDVGRSIETFRHNLGDRQLTDDIRRVLSTGERVEREIRDRRGHPSFLRVLPYRAKGAIDGVVLTLIDVSGLKAAEDALFHERYLLDSLLSNMPDAIYFKDAKGKFIRANQAMAARLGLSDPRDAVGKSAREMPHPPAALALDQDDEAVLRSGEAQHYRLERWERPDGALDWALVTRLPLRDRSDGIVGIIGVFRDVTKQKRADEKIQEAVRRRDQFLAMLSHELRNPLGAVVTATAILKQKVSGTDEQRTLEILERQSRQMARLLDDLLEANRVTENKIELRRRVLDLRGVVGEAAEAVRSMMDARGVSFATDLDPEPLWVDGDAARLQQIQVNLLHNAAKYTPSGGHVLLLAHREKGEAVVRVRDDGAGIAREMLDRVFELFVQAGRTLDRAQGGIGVGLTLVRSLVAMHGGDVCAQSDGEGQGAEFIVRLPLASPAGAVEAPRAKVGELRLPKHAKVAIVEDNADSREMLCEALTLAGFECRSADNGAAGLALIRRDAARRRARRRRPPRHERLRTRASRARRSAARERAPHGPHRLRTARRPRARHRRRLRRPPRQTRRPQRPRRLPRRPLAGTRLSRKRRARALGARRGISLRENWR